MKQNAPTYTRHASRRASQRGIPDDIVRMLQTIGSRQYDGCGGIRVQLDRRCLVRAARELSETAFERLLRFKGAYLVLSTDDEALITVGHQH